MITEWRVWYVAELFVALPVCRYNSFIIYSFHFIAFLVRKKGEKVSDFQDLQYLLISSKKAIASFLP